MSTQERERDVSFYCGQVFRVLRDAGVAKREEWGNAENYPSAWFGGKITQLHRAASEETLGRTEEMLVKILPNIPAWPDRIMPVNSEFSMGYYSEEVA